MTTDEADFSVGEALNLAAVFELDGCIGTPCEVAIVLAAEVRRYRAAVEAVRALRFDLDGGYDDECGVSRAHCSDGAYLDADDVLAILEPKP